MLSTVQSKAWMAAVMPDNKYAQNVCALDAKQNCVWETMDETAPNAFSKRY
jgi:hypothetical protein